MCYDKASPSQGGTTYVSRFFRWGQDGSPLGSKKGMAFVICLSLNLLWASFSPSLDWVIPPSSHSSLPVLNFCDVGSSPLTSLTPAFRISHLTSTSCALWLPLTPTHCALGIAP